MHQLFTQECDDDEDQRHKLSVSTDSLAKQGDIEKNKVAQV